jgi:DNA-binding XRE family transcriptional regulator
VTTTEDPDPARDGQLVAMARADLGWSKEEAARRAGISSITWKRVEDGLPVQDVKLRAVYRTLGWDPDNPNEPIDPNAPEPLAGFSNADLLAELGRRLERATDLGDYPAVAAAAPSPVRAVDPTDGTGPGRVPRFTYDPAVHERIAADPDKAPTDEDLRARSDSDGT